MNYALQDSRPHPTARRETPLKRSGGIPARSRAVGPSTATRTRGRSISSVWMAFSGRRRTRDLPGPDPRAYAGSGASPLASGASRGVVLFVGR